jgi:hypothetical protein
VRRARRRASALTAAVALVALVALATGCGVTVDGVCEDLDDQCGVESVSACKSDGADLERLAEEKGCGALFDDYLTCVSDAECRWRGACLDQHVNLEACVGPFPDDP